METAKLTIRLPKTNIEFAKRYARAYHLTLTELIDRYFRRLRQQEETEIHPEVVKISGLVPSDIDAEAEYHEYLLKKNR